MTLPSDTGLEPTEPPPSSPETAVPASVPSRTPASVERGVEVIRRHLKTLPTAPGVYRMLNAHGDALYVGKAKSLRRRVANYTQVAKLPQRLKRMVAETEAMEFVTTHTEVEALLLESNLIKRLQPRYNVLLKDDKSYPYILLTGDHDYPQLVKHRGARDRKGDYYGPFASGGAVNETVQVLQRAFQIRNCSDNVFANRTRPCLQYHIKRCSAPCVGRIGQEDYRVSLDQARAFLSGKSSEIQAEFSRRMQDASDRLDFEQAAEWRDRIRLLTSIQSRQTINVPDVDDADIVALHQAGGHSCVQVFFFRAGRNYGNRSFFPSHDADSDAADLLAAFLGQFYADKPAPPVLLLSDRPSDAETLAEALAIGAGHRVELQVPQRGPKRKLVEHALDNAREALGRRLSEAASHARLLERVADIFDLDAPPQRVEVYDNSHTGGTSAIGAMIVAGPEGLVKGAYRKFNMQGDHPPGDDYGMMREMLTRRLARLAKEDPERRGDGWPDLLLIDGGQGQLNVAVEVLRELDLHDLPVVAIAKGPDRDAGRERFFMPDRPPFQLEPKDPVLYFLQRLRDEAHRFAIGTHRARRAKNLVRSPLDEVEGIGPRRKKALLHHFGSARAVSQAGLSDLESVPGISRAVARKIYGHFNPDG